MVPFTEPAGRALLVANTKLARAQSGVSTPVRIEMPRGQRCAHRKIEKQACRRLLQPADILPVAAFVPVLLPPRLVSRSDFNQASWAEVELERDP